MITSGLPTADPADLTRSGSLTGPLDQEIANVRTQIKRLTNRRSAVTASLLAVRSKQSVLHRVKDRSSKGPAGPRSGRDLTPMLSAAFDRATLQAKHGQQCLYRLGAGATMFEVKDPDPNAVGDGRVLGVRIEVFVAGNFLPPYYLLLNRPDGESSALCIHRSTIPARIPLPALSARHLGQALASAKSTDGSIKAAVPRQNLPRLVRELRRELVSYHMRTAAITSLGRRCGALNPDDDNGDGAGGPSAARMSRYGITQISVEDAEARVIRLEWADGKIGRVRIGKGGAVQKCVVFGRAGRLRRVERRIMGGERRIEELAERLSEPQTANT
ncbi:MAG: hypothetical protein M1832_003334 [Thelocarpon impressellum]|nr:MAG: hypothetical protein M1832_003334 [Thelocarpon impressellum]